LSHLLLAGARTNLNDIRRRQAPFSLEFPSNDSQYDSGHGHPRNRSHGNECRAKKPCRGQPHL